MPEPAGIFGARFQAPNAFISLVHAENLSLTSDFNRADVPDAAITGKILGSRRSLRNKRISLLIGGGGHVASWG